MLSLQPDFDAVRERYRAFWAREIIDRPPVSISLLRRDAPPFPTKSYASEEERWIDIDYRVDKLEYDIVNTRYFADAIPLSPTNLGPELFSAWCGCGYDYGPDTTWSVPCVEDWARDGGEKVRLDPKHPLFVTLERFTRLLMERGKGRFFVGMTDFHPGGDHLAALRDPQSFAIDLIEQPETVKAELAASYRDFFWAYEYFYKILKTPENLVGAWMGGLFGEGKFSIPSNDFSCMISKKMFDEFFLPGIAEECRTFDQAIYHLDGPGALRHLDSLLDIPELDAVQWVCGAGNEGFARWIPVYQRIQKAGRGVALYVDAKELPLVFETLRPEGVWFGGIRGVEDEETAIAVIKRIEAWR